MISCFRASHCYHLPFIITQKNAICGYGFFSCLIACRFSFLPTTCMTTIQFVPLNLLRINKNIEAKSKLLLNPLFLTLKKEIIHLFIVSLPKVPEFWCFFSNTKLLILGNFYFIIGKSLNSFEIVKL